jgi:NADH-quinone oxidoreductase subunit J
MIIVFLILAAITLLGTAAAMSLKNLVHCVLSLMLGLLGLALIYLQLGAEFVGFTQIIVYVGAVAILAMFAIMMTRGAHEGDPPAAQQGAPLTAARGKELIKSASGLFVAFLVFYLLAWCFLHGIAHRPVTPQPAATVQGIGNTLMHQFAVPLEVVGILLTAALIGAGVLALDDREGVR